jgi:hypothetical protein
MTQRHWTSDDSRATSETVAKFPAKVRAILSRHGTSLGCTLWAFMAAPCVAWQAGFNLLGGGGDRKKSRLLAAVHSLFIVHAINLLGSLVR